MAPAAGSKAKKIPALRSKARRPAPATGTVACWEDDPGDPRQQPPSRPIEVPAPNQSAAPLPFKIGGTAPPPRVYDPGTSNFDFTLAGNDFPAAAIYFEGQNKVWSSESGTLTSQVSSTSQTCSIVLPPYAKTATCNIASFTEQGSVVLSAFAVSGPTNEKVTIGIPSITLRGIWLAITEIQPVPFVATATLGRLLPLAPAPLRVAPGKYRISVRR